MSKFSQNALVSVIIAAYNEEKYISGTLNSILKQSLKPKEVIVVDNASTDSTAKKSKSFSKRFIKNNIDFLVVKEPRKGVARARNLGFLYSKNPIVTYIDADVLLRRDWIEKMVLHFNKPETIAITGIPVMSDAPYFIRIASEFGWYKLLTHFLKIIFGFQTITTANCAIRRKDFIKVGGFDNSCTSTNDLDDTELSSRLSNLGKIVIDENMKVDASFRSYKNLNKAVINSWKRLVKWIEISRKYRNSENQKRLVNPFV